MKFQERLTGLIPEDKKKDAEEIFEQMERTFAQYDEDIKAYKEKLRTRDGVDSKELERLEAENKALKQQLDDMQVAHKKLEDLSKATTDKLSGVTAQLHSSLKDNELRAAMTEYRFDPETQQEAFSLLSSQLKLGVIEDASGTRVMAKIVKDGKESDVTVKEALKGWVETNPLAKRVILTGRTSGTGATGKVVGAVPNKKWSEMSLQERSELFISDRALAEQLMQAKE